LIFRSEVLLEPSASDAAAIDGLGIGLICDLRSDLERGHAPNAWWRGRGVERLDLDILGAIEAQNGPWSLLEAQPDVVGADAVMMSIYTQMPTAAAPHVGIILRSIAAGRLPLLIHCTAGKDRTGFVSAVILAILGVDRDGIVADYLGSSGRMAPRAIAGTRQMVKDRVGANVEESAIEVLLGVDTRYLDASFAEIDARFGGLEGYLSAAGADQETLAAVRARLL
jgi:protein-tyrosine phosphatase